MLWNKVKWAMFGALVPTASGAQPVQAERATSPPPDTAPPPQDDDGPANEPGTPSAQAPRQRMGCGTPGGAHFYGSARLSMARVFTQRAAAGYGGRLEIEMLHTSRKHPDALFGITLGVEGWGSPDGGGGGLPMSFYFGASSPRFFLSVGFGLEWLLIDHVRGNTSLGAFSPLATGTAGFWVYNVRIMAEARAMYRLHLGDENRGQTSLGLAIGLPL